MLPYRQLIVWEFWHFFFCFCKSVFSSMSIMQTTELGLWRRAVYQLHTECPYRTLFTSYTGYTANLYFFLILSQILIFYYRILHGLLTVLLLFWFFSSFLFLQMSLFCTANKISNFWWKIIRKCFQIFFHFRITV